MTKRKTKKSESRRMFYTTSEYIDALLLEPRSNGYYAWKHPMYTSLKDFAFFSNKGAANYDAQWVVDFYKREGKKIKKPTVYRVKFEKVKAKEIRGGK